MKVHAWQIGSDVTAFNIDVIADRGDIRINAEQRKGLRPGRCIGPAELRTKIAPQTDMGFVVWNTKGKLTVNGLLVLNALAC